MVGDLFVPQNKGGAHRIDHGLPVYEVLERGYKQVESGIVLQILYSERYDIYRVKA
jgi:hypothetical protein